MRNPWVTDDLLRILYSVYRSNTTPHGHYTELKYMNRSLKTSFWTFLYCSSKASSPSSPSVTICSLIYTTKVSSQHAKGKKNNNFALVICDSSIQVSLPLEQIYSPLHDLHWTSIGFRAVIFRSPLCLVWMPVETLIQPIVQSFNMVPWAGAPNPLLFNLQPSTATWTIFKLAFLWSAGVCCKSRGSNIKITY